jgi:hypothetical protein
VGGFKTLSLLAGLSALALAAPFSASAAPTTVTKGYTGAGQDWTVPPGVASATFTVEGGSGGGVGAALAGASGGRATASLALTPGQTIWLFVGGQGPTISSATAFNGGGSGHTGGGGGGSDVRVGGTALGNRMLVAGGGGGGGGCTGGPGLAGGAQGGAGGGASGGSGTTGGGTCAAGPGGGGTQTAGGAAGASAGGFGAGGNGNANGGGGGGGWFGGGGGADSGGGGGSGYGPIATVYESGVRSGAGRVTITYYELDLTTSGGGGGYLESSPGGVDCGRNDASRTGCKGGYSQGTTVTLIAHPAQGSDFDGFTSACTPVSGRPNECTVTMDDAKSVNAAFILEPKPLTVVPGGTGAGFVDTSPAGIDCGQNTPGHAACAADYADGTMVTLTAHPDANTDFTGFAGAGCGAGLTCTVTMDAARAVAATFTLKQRALTVSTAGTGSGFVDSSPTGIDCGDGHSTCADSYPHGTNVTLTAHPAANADFGGFSSNCAPVPGQPTKCTATMDQARSVTATFTLKQRALTVTTEGSGAGWVDSAPVGVDCGRNVTGHADCAQDYADGTKVVLTAHPDAASDFGGFSGAGCAGTAATCEITMDQARSVTAGFTAKPSRVADTPAASPETPGTPITPLPARLVLSHRVVLLDNDRALVTLRCRGVAGQSCNGKLLLRSTRHRRRADASADGKATRFTIAAGSSKTLRVAVPSVSSDQIARTRRAVALAVLTLTDGSPTRQIAVTLIQH